MSTYYKRVVLSLTLFFLGILELWLAAACLPVRWQAPMSQILSRVVSSRDPNPSAITHPALDQEIDQALKENIGLRLAFYAILALLLGGNTSLMVYVTRSIPNTRKAGGREPGDAKPGTNGTLSSRN